MRRHRNVKIVATLGPASNDYQTIKALHEAGADVFRLNMSHGTHEEIAERHKIIRMIEKELNSPIAILADLQGPKLRVGVFANGEEELVEGATFRLDLTDAPGDVKSCSPATSRNLCALWKKDAHLLVNDGKIRLRVTSCGRDYADCVVINGGTISNRKGVNVPDVVLPFGGPVRQRPQRFGICLRMGVDWLALSFVQRPRRFDGSPRIGPWSGGDFVKNRKAIRR